MKPLRLALFLILAGITGGCATVDPSAKVIDPVPVYLAEYAIHSDLYMPTDDHYVAYTFGDWNYAALGHTWPNDAFGALFLSFQAALEKRIASINRHTGAPDLREPPQLLIRLTASHELVRRRVGEMEKRFQDDLARYGSEGEVLKEDGTRIYVKDSEHYSIANDCNDLTAATFRALGFGVKGIIVGSHFHISSTAMVIQTQPVIEDSP